MSKPAETETQRACREWWTSRLGATTVAWGRDKNGVYLSEFARNAEAAWITSTDQLRRQLAEAESAKPKKLVGYRDCNCVLPQYCDGKCNPVYLDEHVYEEAQRQLRELQCARDAAADLDYGDHRGDAEFWWSVAAFRGVEMARQIDRAEAAEAAGAKLALAEQDARRYRWLRDNNKMTKPYVGIMVRSQHGALFESAFRGDLDAAIDAELAALEAQREPE